MTCIFAEWGGLISVLWPDTLRPKQIVSEQRDWWRMGKVLLVECESAGNVWSICLGHNNPGQKDRESLDPEGRQKASQRQLSGLIQLYCWFNSLINARLKKKTKIKKLHYFNKEEDGRRYLSSEIRSGRYPRPHPGNGGSIQSKSPQGPVMASVVAFTAEQWDCPTRNNQCANLNMVNQWRPNSFVRSHYSEDSEPRANASLSSVSHLEESMLGFKSKQRLRQILKSHNMNLDTAMNTKQQWLRNKDVRKHHLGSKNYGQNRGRAQKWESGSYLKYLW